MNPPHLRRVRVRADQNDRAIPVGQTRALHRRQALEAQQRAFQHLDEGQAAATPADLAPVRGRLGRGRMSS